MSNGITRAFKVRAPKWDGDSWSISHGDTPFEAAENFIEDRDDDNFHGTIEVEIEIDTEELRTRWACGEIMKVEVIVESVKTYDAYEIDDDAGSEP